MKASQVEPAGLVVEVRTRELINAFVRQLEARGIDVGSLPADDRPERRRRSSRRLRAEAAQSIARELVLEAVVDKLGIEVTDDDIRGELREQGESDEDIEEFIDGGGADRVRDDLRLKRAVDRSPREVKPIAKELAEARESIWTPDKEERPGVRDETVDPRQQGVKSA